MRSFFNLFTIGKRLQRWKKLHEQLERYYPKDTYERAARKEMKVILKRFNHVYYDAYPELIEASAEIAIDYHPKTHSKQYEVQRALKLYKAQKVRYKNLKKIERYLNLQYMIDEQMVYYNNEIRKVRHTQSFLDDELFSSFFAELFEQRMGTLFKIEAHCLSKLKLLEEEKRTCETAISDILQSRDFWGDAGRLIGDMVSESVKHVAHLVDRSLKRL